MIFWIFCRNPKKNMEFFGFSAEIKTNTWKSKIKKKIQNFQNYWAPQTLLEILDFHVFLWIFSRNPKKKLDFFGFSAEIPKNTWIFLDFQQKSTKKTWKILDFQQKSKKAHGFFWIFSRNPKKTWKFSDFQQKSKKHMEIQNFQKFLVRPIFLEILNYFWKFWIS